jgi:hypothetical protein
MAGTVEFKSRGKSLGKRPAGMPVTPKLYLYRAIRAKCLDCCCEVMAEIVHCQVTDCALYSLRPYQRNETVTIPAHSAYKMGADCEDTRY